MVLLDTDTLSHLYAGHPRVIERLSKLEDPDVGTTIVTKVEMLRGRIEFLLKAATGADLLRAQQYLLRTEGLLSEIKIVLFDAASAMRFNQLRANRKLSKIGLADLLISAISLSQRATLVTRNLRHFSQIPELALDNWVD